MDHPQRLRQASARRSAPGPSSAHRHLLRLVGYREPWLAVENDERDLLIAVTRWTAWMEARWLSERTKAGIAKAQVRHGWWGNAGRTSGNGSGEPPGWARWQSCSPKRLPPSEHHPAGVLRRRRRQVGNLCGVARSLSGTKRLPSPSLRGALRATV